MSILIDENYRFSKLVFNFSKLNFKITEIIKKVYLQIFQNNFLNKFTFESRKSYLENSLPTLLFFYFCTLFAYFDLKILKNLNLNQFL